jgi:lysophospholipase L1-like esterase
MPSILFLGDSYTIGEDVLPVDSYPLQLINKLSKAGIADIRHQIIATTGWTTDELLAAVAAQNLPDASFNLVFLCIGVNNQYRGYPLSQYEKEYKQCLAVAMTKAKHPRNVIAISIPDYGVTPFGKANQNKIRNELDIYNLCASSICAPLQIPFINITQLSRLAEHDASLLAADGLHPSGAMYALWVDVIMQTQQKQIMAALKE